MNERGEATKVNNLPVPNLDLTPNMWLQRECYVIVLYDIDW